MINSAIKELEIKILEVINTSNLPISVITLVLEKMTKDANNAYTQAVMQEQQERQAAEQKAQEEAQEENK